MRNHHTIHNTQSRASEQLQRDQRGWDQVYEGKESFDYERMLDRFKRDRPYARRVLGWAQRLGARRSLEFGCGRGGLSLVAARSCAGLHPVLLDLSSAALERAKSAFRHFAQEATFVQAGIPPVPLEDEAFDLVFGHTVLEHLVPYQEAFCELVRVTKAGGIIVLTVPNRYRPDGSLWYKKAYGIEYTQREFTVAELKEMCTVAEVELIEIFGTGLFYVDPMMVAWTIGLGGLVERRLGNPLKRKATSAAGNASRSRGMKTTPPGLALAKAVNRAWLRTLSIFNRLDRFLPLPPSMNLVIGLVACKPPSRT